jgi:type IV pilus assembly protein PilC
MGIQAGLDLPASITLAAQGVGSPGMAADGAILVEAINAGRPLDSSIRTKLIPPTVVTVLSLASTNNDLPGGLNTLGLMFQQQAEMRMAAIPTVFTPVMMLLIGVVVAFVLLAMFAPMISLVTSVSGPHHH